MSRSIQQNKPKIKWPPLMCANCSLGQGPDGRVLQSMFFTIAWDVYNTAKRSLENEHGVPEGVEAVAFPFGHFVGRQRLCPSGKRARQH